MLIGFVLDPARNGHLSHGQARLVGHRREQVGRLVETVEAAPGRFADEAVFRRLGASAGRLDILVNAAWGGYPMFEVYILTPYASIVCVVALRKY